MVEGSVFAYLGEKVVRENEYLSAILRVWRVDQKEMEGGCKCLLSHCFNEVTDNLDEAAARVVSSRKASAPMDPSISRCYYGHQGHLPPQQIQSWDSACLSGIACSKPEARSTDSSIRLLHVVLQCTPYRKANSGLSSAHTLCIPRL